MKQCPVCKSEMEKDSSVCAICSYEGSENEKPQWVFIGSIEDKISADYGKETLKSYEIPAVIFSKSGFFGAAGLPLNPFYAHNSGLFEVSVPEECKKEAVEILTMILGERYSRNDC